MSFFPIIFIICWLNPLIWNILRIIKYYDVSLSQSDTYLKIFIVFGYLMLINYLNGFFNALLYGYILY